MSMPLRRALVASRRFSPWTEIVGAGVLLVVVVGFLFAAALMFRSVAAAVLRAALT